LLVDMDTPEKVRLSPGMKGYGGVDWRDGTEDRYATMEMQRSPSQQPEERCGRGWR
jgi:hypothetical protein